MKKDNLITFCKMYQKQSAKGDTYFVGKAGAVRFFLLQDKRTSEEKGTPVFNLRLEQAEPYQLSERS